MRECHPASGSRGRKSAVINPDGEAIQGTVTATPLQGPSSQDSADAISQEDQREYFCEVCGALAEYGFGVSLKRNVRGRWYCAEHRVEQEPNAWIARPRRVAK
jgi:hypothetical protein